MVIRMRHTRAHSANRRSHHALKGARVSVCSNCQSTKYNHRACMNCGTYKGKTVIDVNKKIAKKAKKAKEKENAR